VRWSRTLSKAEPIGVKMVKVARGKALVAKLRKQAGVRDAEALAAWIGRYKKARKAGKGISEAKQAAGGASKNSSTSKKPSPISAKEKGRPLTKAEIDKNMADDDPFAEDYGDNEEKSAEEKRQERQESQLLKKMEKEERSRLYNVFQEVGGLKTRADLKEEYRAIPNNLKRTDGLPGDEMAEYLSTYYPEFGIESENDLLDFFAPDYRRAA
jgi:hypothetical protein